MLDRDKRISLGRQPRVLGVVLAGGEGRRLAPLTTQRAKPAVPFGGTYRIIDFVLSNLVNSGIHRIKVLTQYKSDSLLSHLARNWRLNALLDHYVEPVPAQQRTGKSWFKGSADAMYQSLNVVADEQPDFVAVFGGDHIYRMDVRQMLAYHIDSESDVTVAALPVAKEEARAFGVIEVNAEGRMIGFEEKPEQPKTMPGAPDKCLVSMGNYIFNPSVLSDAVSLDSTKETAHDFGRNILPALYENANVGVYDFFNNQVPGMEDNERGYWKDVGSIEAYHQASMDLVAVTPVLNLYNERWPIHGAIRPNTPAKFVFADESCDRVGVATDSLVSPGCIVSGGRIDRTVLFPSVRVNSYAHVEQSVLMHGVDIGRRCRIRRAIIDKNVSIPPETEIGFDAEADRKQFFVSEGGVIVIPKNFKFA